jgi:hypothetical protein
MIGLRAGWIFDAPLQSIAVQVRSDDWSCERCWTPAADPDAGTVALAEALFSNPEHAHDSPPA